MTISESSSPFEIKCPNCNAELELDYKELQEKMFICPSCNNVISISDATKSVQISRETKTIEVLTPEWATLMNKKIEDLEARVKEYELKFPNSNLVSTKFWTRAWAVYGHSCAIGLIFAGIMLLITLIIEIV